MVYDRQLRYLEIWNADEKEGTAGYVKIEQKDEWCSLQIQVTGVPSAENGQYRIYLEGTKENADFEREAENSQPDKCWDLIYLHEGKGNLVKRQLPVNRLGAGIRYDQLMTIRIQIRENYMLLCKWRAYAAKAEAEHQAIKQDSGKPETVKVETVMTEQELPKTEVVAEAEPATVKPATVEPEKEEEIAVVKPTEKTEGAKRPISLAGVREQKWKQLGDIYPHISPFRDERDYLSLTPADFVILPQKDYHLVTNSFLLHGYYNYGHLVLTQKHRRGQEIYYLGVPGNFFERERETALLFGFECFEGRTEPASDGEFGYYMIRVEL